MSPSSPDLDVLQTISRRESVLGLLEEGPLRKRALVSELDVSRSTIDRAIRDLEWLGFVDRRDGRYRLTVAGRSALTEHRRCVTALDAIEDVSDLLRHVPTGAPMATDMLVGATADEPAPHAPNEPLEEIANLVGRAERFRGFAAAERIPQFRHQLYERTVDGDLDAEAIFTEELAAFLLEAHPEQLRDMMALGDFDMYSIPSIPYGLGIVETPSRSWAYLVVHGEKTDVQGIIRNDTTDAIRWADRIYRRFRAAATKLDSLDSLD